MFLLKYYNVPLITFDILEDPLDGQSCRILSIDECRRQFLPIGMKTTDAGLMSWLRSRVIPKNREFVDAFLAKNGLTHSNTKGIIEISKGLSLNDSYWVVDAEFTGRYEEYNLYDNEFVKLLSLIAYTGYGSSRAGGFTSSPEFTTGGMLKKGWRRLNGVTMLYKGGTSGAANTGNEPYSEYYAAQIAARMGIAHVDYDLAMWKGNLCSTCRLFTDIDHSYVPMHRFFEQTTLKGTAELTKSIGQESYEAFADMMVFDALILNEDRHFGNFGMMVDNKTNRPYALAPAFDHGLSLLNFAMKDDFEHVETYAATRMSSSGAAFNDIAREFMSARQREQLHRLIGFKFTPHKSYDMPAWRRRALEDFVQKRVAQLLDM